MQLGSDDRRRQRGATLLEFALVVPVILLVLFGVFEFGRYIVTLLTVTTSAREAARYGVAHGEVAVGLPRYADCAGIRQAARDLSVLISPADSQISVTYDNGAGTNPRICPIGGTTDPAAIITGDRIIVSVTQHFETFIPLVRDFLGPVDLISTSRRTIVKGS